MKLRITNGKLGSIALALALSTLLAGCDSLKAPEPEPTPTPAPTPKPNFFDPTLYNTSGVKLNAPGDPKLPEYFQVVRIYSGNLFWIRSVDIAATPTPAPPRKGAKAAPAPMPAGTPINPKPIYGAPEIVRLAGVAVPLPGQPGANEAIRTLTNWTLNRKLDVEQDPKYPVDFDETDLTTLGVPSARRVQIFFDGGGGEQKTKLNLNRMMIRSGFAVVDEHEPTIFDTKGWFNDEEYARQSHLGLWKMGIILNGRQKPPAPPNPGAKSTPVAPARATSTPAVAPTSTPATP